VSLQVPAIEYKKWLNNKFILNNKFSITYFFKVNLNHANIIIQCEREFYFDVAYRLPILR